MIVNWTDEAKASYKDVVNNILDDWNIKIAIQLEENVNELIRNLRTFLSSIKNRQKFEKMCYF